jgi:hypothetical protein
MALDPNYVIAPNPEQYYVDKTTGLPLAGGKVYFYSDVNRATPKPVYTLSGSPPNYSYVELPNPSILSAVGTFQDENGNNVIPYYYPYDVDGNVELYYIEVYSSDDVLQFTREAWPNIVQTAPLSSDESLFNFIPNGQFLAHNNIPANPLTGLDAGKITQPVTDIAQGGWTFDRPNTSTASDFVNYFGYFEYVPNPTASPRFAVVVECLGANPGDAYKDLRIKFNDVNKFASDTQEYTFSFTAATFNSGDFTVVLDLIKNFGTGGSPSPTTITQLTTFNINDTFTIYQFSFVFGTNSGDEVGTNNDDYLQLAISFPTNISFGFIATDFILTKGNVVIAEFPPTTDKDFMARTLVLPTPDPNGFDLGLPLITTKDGLGYDRSSVGKVFSTVYSEAQFGELLADGSQYLTQGYSNDGIPYRRLQGVLYDQFISAPLFGTGINFATANPYISSSSTSHMFLITNKAGLQTNSTDGASGTGFTIATVVTGQSSIGFKSYTYSFQDAKIWAINTSPGVTGTVDEGTTSMSVVASQDQSDGSRYAFTDNQIEIVSIQAFTVPTQGEYMNIATPSNQYYAWFTFDGTGDPAPGGIGLRIILDASMTDSDVTYLMTAAFNGFQVTTIQCIPGNSIGNSTYWQFWANGQAYYVWYNLNNTGTDPAPGGIGIEVSYTIADDAESIRDKTITAINSTYFAVPDLRGLVLKGWDHGAGIDLNVSARYANNPNLRFLESDNLGTLQQDYLLGHTHGFTEYAGVTPGLQVSKEVANDTLPNPNPFYLINSTGTIQNDVKNIYVNFVIKY